MANNIVVMAAGKSGTTALYELLTNAVDKNEYLGSHEPATLPAPFEDGRSEKKQSSRIVKANLESYIKPVTKKPYIEHPSLQKALTYDKKVLLVRDPRDRLLSALMYRGYDDMRVKKKTKKETLDFIKTVGRKCENPASISVQEIMRQFQKNGGRDILAEHLQFTEAMLELEKTGEFFVFSYEDLMDGNLQDLAKYLQIDLPDDVKGGDVNVRSRKRIVRTKSYGEWKNWFTPSDIDFFRNDPLFNEYLDVMGYEPDWELNQVQVIPPEHGPKYIKNLLRIK